MSVYDKNCRICTDGYPDVVLSNGEMIIYRDPGDIDSDEVMSNKEAFRWIVDLDSHAEALAKENAVLKETKGLLVSAIFVLKRFIEFGGSDADRETMETLAQVALSVAQPTKRTQGEEDEAMTEEPTEEPT